MKQLTIRIEHTTQQPHDAQSAMGARETKDTHVITIMCPPFALVKVNTRLFIPIVETMLIYAHMIVAREYEVHTMCRVENTTRMPRHGGERPWQVDDED
jgi:hypothetical protein